MKTKLVIIAGAGSSISDALRKPKIKRPPLDKGFFGSIKNQTYKDLAVVRAYIKKTYRFDPANGTERDSLEMIMMMIYADIHNTRLELEAVPAFRSLIRLFNRRIADTTNNLEPTSHFALYRIVCRELDNGLSPDEICIVTLNQDLQIEKTLRKIQATGRKKRHGRIFSFPYCYCLPNVDDALTQPHASSIPVFEEGDSSELGIRVLKLHGSLNWFSIHHTKAVSKGAILRRTRKQYVTTRRQIGDMTLSKKRKEYSFPMIIPPVSHKAGILHDSLVPVWEEAEQALAHTHRVAVFGYSCPDTDFESANLLRRSVRRNKNLSEFAIIDPNPLIFQRYVELTELDKLGYYRSASAFLA